MSSRRSWQLPGVVALSLVLTLGTAGWGSLYNETDGQYGGAGKVMARNGSWLIPENDGIPRLVKPPLLYWAIGISMKMFGINEFAARVPNAFAVVAWVAATYLIGRRMGGDWRGLLAAIILLTSVGTFTLGRIIMPEIMFSAFVAAALYSGIRAADSTHHAGRWSLAFWFFAALASFTKGWHGLFFPLAIMGFAAVFCKEARRGLRELISWQGVLFFLLINLPWYLYVEFQFPGFVYNLIVAEHLGHILGLPTPATSYTDVPRLQFLFLQLAWLLPWSLGIVGALPLAAAFLKWRRPIVVSLPGAVVTIWGAVVLGSALLAGQRQDYYAMSMWPALALAISWLLERSRVHTFAVILAIALAASLFWWQLPASAPSSATATVAERSTAWRTLASFDQTVWATLRFTAYFSLGGALVFALLGLPFRSLTTKIAAIAAAAVCLDLGAVSGTSLVSPYFSLAKVTAEIPKNATIVYDGGIDTASSLLFYSDSPILLLDQDPNKDFVVRKFGIGRDRFLTVAEFIAFWNSASEKVFITEQSKLGSWKERLGGSWASAARCGTQILLKKVP